jgi:hypothetical protein
VLLLVSVAAVTRSVLNASRRSFIAGSSRLIPSKPWPTFVSAESSLARRT